MQNKLTIYFNNPSQSEQTGADQARETSKIGTKPSFCESIIIYDSKT